jgi:uncharacterized protein (DUF1697 family)
MAGTPQPGPDREVTTETRVALLRAVNVGGRTVSMAQLRPGLEKIGLYRVRTYVQSGNVVFETEGGDPLDLAATIEGLIAREFGLETKVLVLTSARLTEIVAANPFLETGADGKHLHATFLFAPVSETDFLTLRLPAKGGEQAGLDPSGTVVYLHLPYGYGRSKLGNAYFERALSTPATTRNWRTVLTLADMASDAG